MLVCVCRNISENDINELKKQYPQVWLYMYRERLKEDKTRCGACYCYLKEQLDNDTK